jgi:hypothetical protein
LMFCKRVGMLYFPLLSPDGIRTKGTRGMGDTVCGCFEAVEVERCALGARCMEWIVDLRN